MAGRLYAVAYVGVCITSLGIYGQQRFWFPHWLAIGGLIVLLIGYLATWFKPRKLYESRGGVHATQIDGRRPASTMTSSTRNSGSRLFRYNADNARTIPGVDQGAPPRRPGARDTFKGAVGTLSRVARFQEDRHMDALVRPIVGLYGLSNTMLATSIKDLSDQDAKTRARGGTGPSIAWTIGHLSHYKIVVLGLLGQARESPFASKFENTPASDGADYPSLAEMVATFAQLNTDLCTALASAAARLEARMPGAGPHDEKKVLDTVLFFAWHEAYHIGSIGAMRKELGRKGLADLVMGR